MSEELNYNLDYVANEPILPNIPNAINSFRYPYGDTSYEYSDSLDNFRLPDFRALRGESAILEKYNFAEIELPTDLRFTKREVASFVPDQTHAPTAHRFRTRRLREGAVGEYVRSMHTDPVTMQLVAAFNSQRQQMSHRESVATGDHRTMTPFMAGIMSQPEARRSFMEAVDETARSESEAMKETARSKGRIKVDVVIIGAGVQGAIAAARLRAENPELAIMTIDQNDQLGGQFRSYGKRASFRINSRAHRREATGEVALPGGDGNLNPLGELAMIQLPDVTSETYPTNVDMGDVVALNQFFSAPAMLGVRVTDRLQDQVGSEVLTAKDTHTGETYTIQAQSVLALTGSGERKKEPIENVWSVEDVLRHFGNHQEAFPMQAFIDKSIAVIGGGDSGRIVVELLTRLAPKEAYGSSIAQLGSPDSISWYGVDFQSRDEFERNNRSRYEQAQPFIANSDEVLGRARQVRPKSAKVKALGTSENGAVIVTDETGSKRYYDIVIDARNLTSTVDQIVGLSGPLLDCEVTLEGRGMTSIGRQVGNSKVFIGGPAAKTKLTTSELRTFPAALRENTVAIWANGPRVDELAKGLAKDLAPQR